MTSILGSPTLLAINIGSKASEMDGTSEFELIQEAMKELRKMYPTAPDPIDKRSSIWTEDRAAGEGRPANVGTWSVARFEPNDSADLYAAWENPETNRLYWAGDTTSSKYPNTLHGAFESGERAANQVIAKLK